jgi:hypothetical protein
MFKDYYSILKLSYPASDENIKNAYTTIVNVLGSESSNPDCANYQVRVDTEEAYRVLGASYSLRKAYDEEYENAKKEGFDVYEIKDDWLITGIERERDFVINKILSPNYKVPKPFVPKKKGRRMKVLGCLGKAFLVYVALMSFVYISKCSREKAKESYELSSTMNSTENAENQLRRFIIEKNINLPQDMDENITTEEVLLERDALVYVYKVDDNFFSEFKEHAMSRNIQLSNLKTVYHEMKPMIDLLVETHRGIYYRYICRESGEISEFKIYYSDLSKLK